MNPAETVLLTPKLKARLIEKGVDNLWQPGSISLPLNCQFESPCSTKWMEIHHSISMGAFSYAVSGYFFACKIGRYCSIGENVQVGRGDHPLDWLSTSPFQYLDRREIFSYEGFDFEGGLSWESHYKPHYRPIRSPNQIKHIEIGNDVWIGQGAYIKPGIKIGNGSVIGAHAVVTKNVPAYAIVAGNPANVKKMRFEEGIIERLEEIKWWQYAIWDISKIQFDNIYLAIETIEELAGERFLTPYMGERINLSDIVINETINTAERKNK
jgi:acetyltransferase-like isoleucine patch superfamily enzyme